MMPKKAAESAEKTELSPAQQLAARRWAGTTKAERSKQMSAVAAGRNAALSPEKRSEIARKAAAASAKVRTKNAKKKASAKKK